MGRGILASRSSHCRYEASGFPCFLSANPFNALTDFVASQDLVTTRVGHTSLSSSMAVHFLKGNWHRPAYAPCRCAQIAATVSPLEAVDLRILAPTCLVHYTSPELKSSDSLVSHGRIPTQWKRTPSLPLRNKARFQFPGVTFGAARANVRVVYLALNYRTFWISQTTSITKFIPRKIGLKASAFNQIVQRYILIDLLRPRKHHETGPNLAVSPQA